jgi:membrane-bound metal-dependent hydrolase YbcI (DUF457 family)
MMYYDHAMVGAALAVAVGAQRRHGWPIVAMAAMTGMLPDWDDVPRFFGPVLRRESHRVWGHNLLVGIPSAALYAAFCWLCLRSARTRWSPKAGADRRTEQERSALGAWVAVGVLVALAHLLTDVIWSADREGAPWPVPFLWPFSHAGAAVPVLASEDWVATAILAVGLAIAWCLPTCARLLAVLSLMAVAAYAGIQAALVS